MTSDDRIWIRALVELAIREIVDALKGDGAIAASNFRLAYRKYQQSGRTDE